MVAGHGMADHTPGHAPSTPCHGPNCHSDNKFPTAPMPTVKIVVPQWAVSLVHHTHLRCPVGLLPDDADLSRSQYLSDPPLRPPRSV